MRFMIGRFMIERDIPGCLVFEGLIPHIPIDYTIIRFDFPFFLTQCCFQTCDRLKRHKLFGSVTSVHSYALQSACSALSLSLPL